MTYFLYVFAREQSDRGNLPGGWLSAKHIHLTLVVGYFAYAQYDTLDLGDCRGTSSLAMTTSRAMVRWDISLTLNMTHLIWGIAALTAIRHLTLAR